MASTIENDTTKEVLEGFRDSLTRFVHFPKMNSEVNASRRSPQKTSLPKKEEEDVLPSSFPDMTRGRKRARQEDKKRALSRSPRKPKRSYAAPETYAHLENLHDHLKEELDVMFCGINPGYKSAETGHHFANPSNHFWRCLHQSGLTERYVSPTEDSTLPDLFCLGLTNLVDRPSSEEGELSLAEKAAAVPIFLSKVSRYRPRIVCFVGMGIWADTVEKALRKLAVPPDGDPRSATPNASDIPKKKSPKPKKTSGVCLQPYKMVHRKMDGVDMSVTETFFFVVPSTSGRVTQFQLPDKIKLFVKLKACVEDLKQSKIDTTNMAVFSLPAQ